MKLIVDDMKKENGSASATDGGAGGVVQSFKVGVERVRESVTSRFKRFTHLRSSSAPAGIRAAPRVKFPRPAEDQDGEPILKGLEALYESEDVRNRSFDSIIENFSK